MTRHPLWLVHAGDGKGKTTAALGLVLRALGHGHRVSVIQFIKGNWKTGEAEAAKRFENLEWLTLGKGFTWLKKPSGTDEEAARSAWEACRERLAAGKHDLLVFDEIHHAIRKGYVPVADVVSSIRARAGSTHVVTTGRGAPPEIVEAADLVSEMRLLKHPYGAGVKAQEGIEF
ncbi:MAG: cob(I)yrinic acid a,c-diamide adenosyltransferase [Planctomycetes bacterium]|nr:cob(I)yrinic acid a,c-diamide adenosyltransferase [Planctomycetota bacterium]